MRGLIKAVKQIKTKKEKVILKNKALHIPCKALSGAP